MPPSPEQVAALLSKRDATIRRVIGERDALKRAMEEIIKADTCVSDGGKRHDHGHFAGIAIEALAACTRPDAGGAA